MTTVVHWSRTDLNEKWEYFSAFALTETGWPKTEAEIRASLESHSPEFSFEMSKWAFENSEIPVFQLNNLRKVLQSATLTEAQRQDLDVKWLTRVGTSVYSKAPPNVQAAFEGALTEFLGDDEQIDMVSSAETARALAYELFSGRRRLFSLRYIPTLNAALHHESPDMDSLKQMIREVRAKQRDHFRKHGFLDRLSSPAIPSQEIDERKNSKKRIVLIGGKRSLEAFISGKSDGAYVCDDEPGIPFHKDSTTSKRQMIERHRQEALTSAQKNCDEAVIIIAKVAQKYLSSERLYSLPELSLEIVEQIPIPFEQAFEVSRTEDTPSFRGFKALSPEPERPIPKRQYFPPAHQKPPTLDQKKVDKDSPPADLATDKRRAMVKVAVVLAAIFLIYRFAYPKIKKWWKAPVNNKTSQQV